MPLVKAWDGGAVKPPELPDEVLMQSQDETGEATVLWTVVVHICEKQHTLKTIIF